MIAPEAYFTLHDLWNFANLEKECERSFVRISPSPITPSVVMLHYTDDAAYDKQWNNFNRMCRGLIVDIANRKILAYPFDKFFNLDEMPETAYSVLEELGSFEATEKLDGSMLILYRNPTTSELFLTTKGSMKSEHGVLATSMIPDAWKQIGDGVLERFTFVFELISYKYSIVINYQKKGYPEGLYLIGVRDRYTNIMLPVKQVKEFAQQFKVPTVKTYEFYNLDALIENTKTLTVLEEGYVLKFADRLVKIKGKTYLAAHRFISKLSRKSILECLGMGTGGELLTMAPEEYRAEVESEITNFKKLRTLLVNECYQHFSLAPKETRKEFALWVQGNVPADLKPFMFHLIDGKPLPDKKVYDLIGIRENVSGETRI